MNEILAEVRKLIPVALGSLADLGVISPAQEAAGILVKDVLERIADAVEKAAESGPITDEAKREIVDATILAAFADKFKQEI